MFIEQSKELIEEKKAHIKDQKAICEEIKKHCDEITKFDCLIERVTANSKQIDELKQPGDEIKQLLNNEIKQIDDEIIQLLNNEIAHLNDEIMQPNDQIIQHDNEIKQIDDEIKQIEDEIKQFTHEIALSQNQSNETTIVANRLIAYENDIKVETDTNNKTFSRDFCILHDYFCLIALLPENSLSRTELILPAFLLSCLDYDLGIITRDEFQPKLDHICDMLIPDGSFII